MTFRLLIVLFLLPFSQMHLYAKEPHDRGVLETLWGRPPESVVYLGMWTYHFHDNGRANCNNHAYGIEHNGYFVSTMINTYHQQCYSLGISRHIIRKDFSKNFSVALGYRLGGIYGYDKELKSIANFAERYKILPYGQLYTHFIYRRLRFELSYINKLVSLHFAVIWKKF